MKVENMKNMLVLRDLPSNIVEEAIVIMKPNIKIKDIEYKKDKIKNEKFTKEGKEKTRDKEGAYIIKEAEMLISNYISQVENPIQTDRKTKKILKKYERLKKVSLVLGVIAFVLGTLLIL